MAVGFPLGFIMSHNEPVDNRLVLTKKEMVAMRKTKMPNVYLCVCSDDGLLYLYNINNDNDPETGKFRVFQASASDNIEVDADAISLTQIQTLFKKGEE